ncbi:MAG TPA: winged helix DNA-binding domain-containing protein [Solirubrobacteraceae bacterium]
MTAAPGAATIRGLRLRAQHLTGPPATAVQPLVAALAGVQAQDPVAAALALRPRSRGLDAAAVWRARDEDRSVVWTWAMRGTLHLVAAADVGWILGLLGPIFVAAGRRRRLQLGLTDELCERALADLREILAAAGPLPRSELARRLAARGVTIDPAGQAPAHLVAYAALRGVICRVGDGPAYALLDEWLGTSPRALEPDRALAELTRRYLGAHGPAGAADLAAWSGIGLRRARRGLELVADELRAVPAASGPGWMLAGAAHPLRSTRPRVALLGHFDPYLLGYADRDLVLDRRFARRIQAGGGFIRPAVLVDGRVVGTWRRQRSGDRLDVALEPFEELSEDAAGALEREAGDVARFLGAGSLRLDHAPS